MLEPVQRISILFDIMVMISLRSRRSMDRIAPSEGADAGSIPAESTKIKRRPWRRFSFMKLSLV